MKPFMAIVVLLCLLGITCLNATIAQEPQQRSDRRCRGNTDLVGECFEFHGRMFVSNGTPGVRIWPVGTKRLLGVLPSEQEILPSCLLGKLEPGTYIYGDYTVCPFTRERPGEMRMVCVEEARNLIVEKFDSDGGLPEYSRSKGCSLMGTPAR